MKIFFLTLLFIDITEQHLYWLGVGALSMLTTLAVIAASVETLRTKWLTPIYQRFWVPRRKKQQQMDELLESVATLKTQTAEIRAEVKPNGGSSLNDKVTRIERSLEYQACELHFRRQTLPQGVFQMDENMNWKSVNRALCDMLNVESGALLERGWINSIERTMRERVQTELKQAIENRIPVNSRWEVLDAENEEVFEVRVHAEPYSDHQGNLLCFHGEIIYSK
jgi:PAS domain S-box-containing protein